MGFWTVTPPSRRDTFRSLGRRSFDGKGNFTNTLTFNNTGTVTRSADSGSYTVNADCTGKIFILGGTGTTGIVLVNGGKEFYSLATVPSFPRRHVQCGQEAVAR